MDKFVGKSKNRVASNEVWSMKAFQNWSNGNDGEVFPRWTHQLKMSMSFPKKVCMQSEISGPEGVPPICLSETVG